MSIAGKTKDSQIGTDVQPIIMEAVDPDRRHHKRSNQEETVVNHFTPGALPSHESNIILDTVKRAVDIMGSIVALTLAAPLLIVCAALIKLTSKGPVFFSQIRVGKAGRLFRMYKFRTMVVNAEELKQTLAEQNEVSGPVFKMKNDPRVTWIGRFLRKTSLDELPQFINVLLGDMSIVGPRPPVPKEVKQYRNWQMRRLSVKPGITCIWQVSGRNQIEFEDWVRMDLRYIDHWDVWLDLQLIFKTFKVVFIRPDGA